MDPETENVVKLISPGNIPDNWQENPDFLNYISKLGSYGVEQLVKEPDHLSEEAAAILEQTQELAFTNYKTFIQTAECSREIFRQFENTEARLDDLVRKLPEFAERCRRFGRASGDVGRRRRLNSLTLTRSARLLEVLELPQLAETCVSDGRYEEALELAAHARRLGARHGQIPVVAGIARDVEAARLGMVHRLLSQLRSSDLQLPACLQAVGLLRRSGLLSEAELRLKFLQARDAWLQGLLAGVPSDDANQHLSKTIELTRIHLFNIVTQYRAIFSDEDPIMPSSKEQNVNEVLIFYSWLTEKVSQFLAALEQDLPRVGSGSLDSLLGQCMYFGLSLGRVGADFRGLAAPPFVRAAERNFERAVRGAAARLEGDLRAFALAGCPGAPPRAAPQPSQQDGPPRSLLEFPPLAEYCNGLAGAFNELRLCAPAPAARECTRALQASLRAAAGAARALHRREQQALAPAGREQLARLCAALGGELAPYAQRCLHAVFPPAAVARHLGLTAQQLQREGVTYLNQTEILAPISHLLPVTTELPPVTNMVSGEDGDQKNHAPAEVMPELNK
ncbi:conserved oligomeric Golgi complex subunit 8 [Bacillus rossius redtenbacheri]|uniref:conserved oligomeric Golgi complex subunit 8 n=1 Tax=Bacillus rossius redtenbacheri TaxID=93214 RepID=UPI002FDD1625